MFARQCVAGKKGEEGAETLMWISRKNRKVEIYLSGSVLPGQAYSMQQRYDGPVTILKLEAVQKSIGKRLFGASRRVDIAAVTDDVGWRKLEERQEKKRLHGRYEIYEQTLW